MANIQEALVATLFDQSDAIADLVLGHHPVLRALEEKGNVKRKSGGYEFRKPVMYNDTAVGNWYSGYSSFNLTAVDDLTAFIFQVKQAYEPVSISGRERRANRGEAELLDLVEAKIEAATKRLRNTVANSIRGDGTGAGGLEIDGLKKAVSTSPSSGTYGGIDRSANTFARNVAVNVTLSASNVQDTITDTISQITRGDEMPDLGVCDRTAWKHLHSSLTAIQRIQAPKKKGEAGFRLAKL
jgi:hypothetical protein